MQPIEIVAQAVGIVAMAFNIVSYQCKKQSTVTPCSCSAARFSQPTTCFGRYH